MKITPTAIRQKTFESGFRGFEKKEVQNFLEEIAEIVDHLHKENIDLKSKLQQTESEAKRLKDVEDSLFRTLKTAEDTGASIIEEANEAADLIIEEANQTASSATQSANELYQEAIKKAEGDATIIIGAAEKKAQDTIVELRDSMQDLVRSYEGLVEQREALVKSLRRITQDAANQVDLSEVHFSRIDAKAHKRAIEELSRAKSFTFANISNLSSQLEEEEIQNESEEAILEEEVVKVAEEISEEAENVIEEVEEELSQLEEESEEIIEEEVKDVEEVQEPITSQLKIEPKQQESAPASNEGEKKPKADGSGSFFDNL